jgi:hypothetical protein
MSVHLKSQGVIELSGRCGADDAEALQEHLLAMSGATVEWSDCEHLHSAVVQVLLVGAPLMHGAPKNEFLTTHIAPILGLSKVTAGVQGKPAASGANNGGPKHHDL